jgi:hypothetical protein
MPYCRFWCALCLDPIKVESVNLIVLLNLLILSSYVQLIPGVQGLCDT